MTARVRLEASTVGQQPGAVGRPDRLVPQQRAGDRLDLTGREGRAGRVRRTGVGVGRQWPGRWMETTTNRPLGEAQDVDQVSGGGERSRWPGRGTLLPGSPGVLVEESPEAVAGFSCRVTPSDSISTSVVEVAAIGLATTGTVAATRGFGAGGGGEARPGSPPRPRSPRRRPARPATSVWTGTARCSRASSVPGCGPASRRRGRSGHRAGASAPPGRSAGPPGPCPGTARPVPAGPRRARPGRARGSGCG